METIRERTRVEGGGGGGLRGSGAPQGSEEGAEGTRLELRRKARGVARHAERRGALDKTLQEHCCGRARFLCGRARVGSGRARVGSGWARVGSGRGRVRPPVRGEARGECAEQQRERHGALAGRAGLERLENLSRVRLVRGEGRGVST